MISLEQVRQLDIRVKKAVGTLKALSAENDVLKQRIGELEADLTELRDEASAREADEQQLEVSLQGVLDILNEVEPEAPGENDGTLQDAEAPNPPETESETESHDEAPPEQPPANKAGAGDDGSSEDAVLDDNPADSGEDDQFQSEFDIF